MTDKPQWEKSTSEFFDLELVNKRWKLSIHGSRNSPRARVALWLVRMDGEYNMISIAEDKPIVCWSDIMYEHEDDLIAEAVRRADEFIDGLSFNRPWREPRV